jgi:hypothetical protein
VATNKTDRWFFLFGFEKNERENITPKELRALKAISEDLLALSPEQLDMSVAEGTQKEIGNEHEERE